MKLALGLVLFHKLNSYCLQGYKPGTRINMVMKSGTRRNIFIKPCSKPGTRSGENINLWPSDALPTIMVVRFDESLTLTPKG